MAVIEYPSQLPLPLQDGYALETFDPMIRTQMVTGRARQRIRFSQVPTFVRASFIYSEAQAAFFEAWYARVLGNGIEWFSCRLQTPEGIKSYQVRFTGIYEGPSLVQGRIWKYSARIELRQRPLIPEGWELVPGLWFNKNIIDVALNRNWPVMVFDYPTYAAAMAVIRSLRSGASITIATDETQEGRHSVYTVVRSDSPSLNLDFMSQAYLVGQPNDYLALERSYAG
ncbi:hypothetical protein [Pseudomonas putida]|uniref:hypothetical protein n=1 Tax=Pseudomonas putida TaxID=303 RepID=UPI003242DE67